MTLLRGEADGRGGRRRRRWGSGFGTEALLANQENLGLKGHTAFGRFGPWGPMVSGTGPVGVRLRANVQWGSGAGRRMPERSMRAVGALEAMAWWHKGKPERGGMREAGARLGVERSRGKRGGRRAERGATAAATAAAGEVAGSEACGLRGWRRPSATTAARTQRRHRPRAEKGRGADGTHGAQGGRGQSATRTVTGASVCGRQQRGGCAHFRCRGTGGGEAGCSRWGGWTGTAGAREEAAT
nr:collagen alpha-1(I) chain-like [Aegilops tauschii subsp. strangulata]